MSTSKDGAMSPEAQRIAIAEACGYFPAMRGICVWYEREGGHVVFGDLPDYMNDLNAMHEAEKVLTPVQVLTGYSHTLIAVTKASGGLEKTWLNVWALYHATAAQRAEAFLRTIGKWSAARSATQTKETP